MSGKPVPLNAPASARVAIRGGSRQKKNGSAGSIPAIPRATNTICQGASSPIRGKDNTETRWLNSMNTAPIRNAALLPSTIPIEYTAMGLPRRSGGKLSAIIEVAQGLSVASPIPTVMRATNN